MNYINLLLYLLCFAIIVYLYPIVSKKEIPKVYEFINNKNNNGLNLLIVSGTHGNEKSGPYTLQKLINNNYFNNKKFKKITIIPIVNKFGHKYNIRYQNDIFHPDINRTFYLNTNDPIANFIIQHAKEADIIIDFLEGYDYYSNNKKSIGSTITTSKKYNMIVNTIKKLNDKIKNPYKKFINLINKCNIKNTLCCYFSKYYPNKITILVEITGQNETQPMNIRYEQIKQILDEIFLEYS
jgi:predicted deacylase